MTAIHQQSREQRSLDFGPDIQKAEQTSVVPPTLSASEHSRRVMTASKDMTWVTPQEWFNYLDLEFDFTLDPCCEHETAKCKKHYTPEEDGLSQSWQDERVFMNPPYGRDILKWIKKAYEESRDNGALVVCFVPARVDTNWWHQYATKGEVRFPKGRVKFEGADASAPFPVAIVIFRPRSWYAPLLDNLHGMIELALGSEETPLTADILNATRKGLQPMQTCHESPLKASTPPHRDSWHGGSFFGSVTTA